MSYFTNENETPTPETKSAILMCEGRCIRPTKHFYRDSLPSEDDKGELGINFMFYCKHCSHERQWGRENMDFLAFEEDDALDVN